MRKATFLRVMALILLLMLSLTTLVGCANMVTGDEAKATVNEFMEALRVEDYEKAGTLLLPKQEEADVRELCDTLRNTYGIDFKDGVTDKQQTNFYAALYNSAYKGSGYEMTFNAKVGEKEVTITAAVVRNSDGYGIYGFSVSPRE